MTDLYEMNEAEEKVILVAVSVNGSYDPEESLDELEELVKTAGAAAVGRIIQNREHIHPGTYIGKGKIEETAELAASLNAQGIVCDDELTPAQMKNLEEALKIKVMDRTMLILDIFAKRAVTKEGKIQVELAQLKYRSTRLIGMRNSLSRLGGGIGTRGPGEKKLETDRRLIKDRIAQLNYELKDIIKNRETTRAMRSKSPIPIAAIVGYTNAGKSTLLNHLTGAGVLEEDKLFATLDPTTRKLEFESGGHILLTDTVGFIRKLPHHLIEAFKSTLEEAKYADMILHVVDASSKNADIQMHVVYETLRNLGVVDKPVVTLFNKQDLLEEEMLIKDLKADKVIKISAKTGQGIQEMLKIVEEMLLNSKVLIEKVIGFNEAGRLQAVRKYGQLIEEEYREDGIYIKAFIPKEMNI